MTAPTPLNPTVPAPHWLDHPQQGRQIVDWMPSPAIVDVGYWVFKSGLTVWPSMAEGWTYVAPVATAEDVEGMRADLKSTSEANARLSIERADLQIERDHLRARIAALEQERNAAVVMLGEGERL